MDISALALSAAFALLIPASAAQPEPGCPAASAVTPCTTFCLPATHGPVFGRNYDWGIGFGLVTVNRRGLQKSAFVAEPTEPAKWISKYGSLTFNQYGRELPTGGMNEAGLVVEVMWLTDTRYPDPDSRAGLGELGWVQYQLDTCKSVAEVLATDSKIRVTTDSTSIHFLICDASGEQATVEFLDGKLVAHTGGELPISALANDTYADSMEYLETIQGFGGERPTPKSRSSLDRFVRAACGVVEYEPGTKQAAVDYSFDLLKNVSQGDYTQWSIVYDIAERALHFRTQNAPTIKTVKFASFDFSATSPCRILDIDTPKAGDPTKLFKDYTVEANLALIRKSFKGTEFLADRPESFLLTLARYPETMLPAKEQAAQPEPAGGR